LTGRAGDEEDILTTGVALVSDEGVLVALNASIPPQDALALTIDEKPDADGARRLTFVDGRVSAPLTDGLNNFSLQVQRSTATGGSTVTLVVQTTTGSTVAKQTFRLAPVDFGALSVSSLVVA